MTVSFDFQNVTITEFGVGRDEEKGDSFLLVPIDSDVQVALHEMAIASRRKIGNVSGEVGS
jgi:hypothetical protein